MSELIKVSGAREHNLKNVDVEIPRDKLVVITGLSGSGKSSLAFDTIYAEVDAMSRVCPTTPDTLGIMDKPDVDNIEGLSQRLVSIKSLPAVTRAVQSRPSPKFMTICVYCTHVSACRTVGLR